MEDMARKRKEMAVEALRNCFERVPFAKIESVEDAGGDIEAAPDLRVTLLVPEGKRQLAVAIRNNGEPRIARIAVRDLLDWRQEFPGTYGVFVAPYISQRSAGICADEGVGYVDFAGNCRISFGQVLIEREGKPNLFVQRRGLRSAYSKKAARVLRVLLSRPKEAWKVQDLAEEADVSIGQVSKVKKLLNDREFISEERVGFRLREPEALLKDWARNYTYKKNRVREFFSLKRPAEIEEDISRVCDSGGLLYALTAFSAAARLAPAVRTERVFAYVEDTTEDIEGLLNLRRVSSGANVSLLTPYDEGVFYGRKEVDGILVASPIQVYLDLAGFRGRGEEAAEVFLKEVISIGW